MLEQNTTGQTQEDYIQIDKREHKNREKPQNDKLIRRLLLIITMVDPKRLTFKSKQVLYIREFVQLYNWKNFRQVHEIYQTIELRKMRSLTEQNLQNFCGF